MTKNEKRNGAELGHKILLSDLIPEENTFCVNKDNVKKLINQIESEISTDDSTPIKGLDSRVQGNSFFTISRVKRFLERMEDAPIRKVNKLTEAEKSSGVIVDYKGVLIKDSGVKGKVDACLKVRRDSDCFYPQMNLTFTHAKNSVYREIDRVCIILEEIIKICFAVSNFVADPVGRQFRISDFIDLDN